MSSQRRSEEELLAALNAALQGEKMEVEETVEVMASSALCEKLERALSLMRADDPAADLSLVVERALDLLIARSSN